MNAKIKQAITSLLLRRSDNKVSLISSSQMYFTVTILHPLIVIYQLS